MWWGCCAVYAVCAVVGSHEVVCAPGVGVKRQFRGLLTWVGVSSWCIGCGGCL